MINAIIFAPITFTFCSTPAVECTTANDGITIITMSYNYCDDIDVTAIVQDLLIYNVKQYYIVLRYRDNITKLDGIVPRSNLNPNSPIRGTPK